MLKRTNKLTLSERIVAFTLVIVVALSVALGIYWLIWLLWCYVATSFFPDASTSITSPGFWEFSAALILFSILTGFIRITRKEK